MLRVACAAEGEAYVAHAAAMLHSVLQHADDVEAHFMHTPNFAWRDEIGELVEQEGGVVHFHEIAFERVAPLPVTDYFTSAMWLRIFLPELLPDADKVLYLDADTLAVAPLAPLWDTDLTGHSVAAVTNVFQHNHVQRPAELGLSGPEVYFNSGVLLINLADWRHNDTTRALYDLAIDRSGELAWPDQDALNLVLGERRLALHPRWNAMNSLDWDAASGVFGDEQVAEARARPGIRHFEGPDQNKPWHRGCRGSLRDLYFEHRAATPWPDVELIGEPLAPRRGFLRQVLTAMRPV
jgi:lipopolysaccharide biosynthesis glycosyltransferase